MRNRKIMPQRAVIWRRRYGLWQRIISQSSILCWTHRIICCWSSRGRGGKDLFAVDHLRGDQAKGSMKAGQKLVRDPGSAFGVIPRITRVSGMTAAYLTHVCIHFFQDL